MHPVFLFEFEYCQLWLHFLFVNLSLSLSNSLVVLLFNRDPLELVDCSMILVPWWN